MRAPGLGLHVHARQRRADLLQQLPRRPRPVWRTADENQLLQRRRRVRLLGAGFGCGLDGRSLCDGSQDRVQRDGRADRGKQRAAGCCELGSEGQRDGSAGDRSCEQPQCEAACCRWRRPASGAVDVRRLFGYGGVLWHR